MLFWEAHFAGFNVDYLANSIIGGNLTNLFTLEIFVRMTPRWPFHLRQTLDLVRGLHSELEILSTEASLTPSGTAPLQNLRIVLSELTFPHDNRPLLDAFAGLDRVLSRTQFCHLEKISITLQERQWVKIYSKMKIEVQEAPQLWKRRETSLP